MKLIAALLVALFCVAPSRAYADNPSPVKWDLAACSRSVVRCGADVDACLAKLRACDAQRLSERRATEAWRARTLEAHRIEREALRSEALALRMRLEAPTPWWESPILWGVVGLAVGGVGVGLAVHYLGGKP